MIKAIKTLWSRWTGVEALELQLNNTLDLLDVSKAATREARGERDRLNVLGLRLRTGLENIQRHAASNPGFLAFAPEVLRDYCDEVLRNHMSNHQQINTDGVSAASRWGYDFTKAPKR
jgi:hypothetical protein